MTPPQHNRNHQIALKLRTNAYHYNTLLIKMEMLPQSYENICPLCKNNVPDNWQHTLLYCPILKPESTSGSQVKPICILL